MPLFLEAPARDPELTTVTRLLEHTTLKHKHLGFIGERFRESVSKTKFELRGFEFSTYEKVRTQYRHLAQGLRSLGLSKGAHVGVWSRNRVDWALFDYACAFAGFVSVALYDTLGPDVVEYVVQHAELDVVLISPEHLADLQQLKGAKHVVVFNSRFDDVLTINKHGSLAEAPMKVHLLGDVMGVGSMHAAPIEPADVLPGDLFTIMYTSGTTGMPKGVMLTHRNMMSAVGALEGILPDDDSEDQSLLSYLPLAHIYERVIEYVCAYRGRRIGYFTGDLKMLIDDCQLLRPTVFIGVPRVYQRIYDGVQAGVQASNPIRRALFAQALAAKREAIKRQETTPFWEKLVFSKVQARMGGRVSMMSSGSAPMPSDVAEFLSVTFNALFKEGYGLTETAAALTAITNNQIGTVEYGHVGAPLPCNEVKLVDVPDMKYLTTDKPNPRGEIWVRGSNVFVGYYKQPEITAEVMEDGWFKTGDIGMWRQDGNLQIIDRKKNIFKLSQGEYVRPEYIENVYMQSPLVGAAFVYGDSLKDHLVGVFAPDFDAPKTVALLAELGLTGKPRAEIVKDQRFCAAITESLGEFARRAKLNGFEHVRAVHVTAREFTPESGLLTPSMKLKRLEAKEAFADVIAALYKQPKPRL